MTSRSNRLRLRPFRNKKNTIIRGMVRQEIKIFCHRYRGTNHPLLISTFDDHRPHIKTDYKRVAKGIDQITGSPSKVIYLLKNVHFYRNKNTFWNFSFSIRIPSFLKLFISRFDVLVIATMLYYCWGFWMLI